MGLATLLLATSFVVGSIAGPLSHSPESQCASTCTVSNKFQYEVGRSYIYQYEAKTATQLISKPNEASNLLIKATATVQIISQCNLRLTLRDVELKNPDNGRLLNNNDVFKSSLEANTLDFSFQDGVIEQLCPRPNEQLWVLNIKRGILSTFQNSMKTWNENHNTQETDVTGKCATDYQVTRGGWLSDSVITKTKDLLKCSDRTDHYTWIQSAPHHPSIVPQSSPLLKSTHKCTYTIRKNTLFEAICTESHQFQPFNTENSGATTFIEQSLTFQKSETSAKINVIPVGPRTTLLFDHRTQENGETAQNAFDEALRQLCAASEQDIRPNVPQLFSQFVKALKKLSYDNLQQTYTNIDTICPQNTKAKKLFMDAIPLAGSEAAVAFMTTNIVEGQMSHNEIDSWLTTLSLLPNPSSEMLKASTPLLNLQGHRSKALLSISALTHTFCQNRDDCGHETQVANVIVHIISQMPANCQTKDENSIELIITQLKALGNIGYIDQAIQMVQSCYKTIENPIEVRLAAIDAHRRMSCKNRNTDILNTYLNREEDSEVRIGAYLIAMKCSSEYILDKVETSLINEDVNQVGSFVWTHLTNIQQSGNPNKAMTKKILSSKKLQKKFSTDVRKFSRYYEGSIYMNSIQTGAHVDGTVIFSPKSYLPRSTNLALTLDIFGQSIDLFEFGARMEGFEQLVEAFFGREGHFPDETIHQMLESYRDKKTEDKSKLNQIATIFNSKNAKPDQPRGSLYTRLFGNDVQFVKYENLDQLLQRSMNVFFNVDQLTKFMNGEEIDVTKNSMILDSSLTIPTSIGLPLNLKVNGTSAVNLQIGGKFDTTQIQSKSLTVEGHIKPSAAIEINGAMIVDAFVTRSGLKISTLIHTSTEAEAELIVKDGQMIKSQIHMAKDQMEIFDFRSSLIVVDGDSEKELNSQELQHMQTCTGEFMSTYLGLEFCSDIIYPTGVSTPLILSGPLVAKINLQKTDKMLTTYDFEYRWSREPVPTKTGEIKYMRIGKLSLDTHKSSVNRELTAEFVYNEANGNISLRFISPIKKATFNGNLVNEPDHKRLDALVLVDENECLALQSELRSETMGNKYRVTPSLAVRLNGQPLIILKGSVLTQDKKKYSADFTIEHITEKPITLYGLASKTERNGSPRYDIDFNVNSDMLQTYGKWFYQTGQLSMATKGTLDYKWPQEDKQSITFSAKSTVHQQNAKLTKTNVEVEFQWTAYPKSNWIMVLDMQRNGDQLDNIFTLHYGAEDQRSHNTIKIEHSYRGHGSLLKHHLTTSIKVQFPPANIDTKLDIRSDITSKNLDTSIVIQFTPQKKIALIWGMQSGDESREELISGFARLTYPANELEISGSITQPETDSLVITTVAKWAKNTQATLIITIRNHGPHDVNSWGKETIVDISLPGQQPLRITGDIVINSREQSTHGEALINGKTYRTFAEYHRPSFENVRIIAGVKSPSTTYSAAADMRYSDKEKRLSSEVIIGNYQRVMSEMQWKKDGDLNRAYANIITDADNFPSAVYSLRLTLQKLLRGSQGTITLLIPSMNEMGVEWKSKTEVSSGRGPITYKGECQLWWAPAKKVTMEVNLTSNNTISTTEISNSAKFNTPWTNVIQIYSYHNADNQKWSNNLDIRHEKEPILSIATDGTYSLESDVKQVTSNVKLSTRQPIVTLKIDHQWSETLIKSQAIVNSGKPSEFRLSVYGEDKRKVDHFGFSGSVDMVTQCPFVKKLGLNTNITFGQVDHAVNSVLTWNDNVITADYSGYVKRNGNEVAVASNINVQTPFLWMQQLSSNFLINTVNNSPTVLNYAVVANKKYSFKMALNAKTPNNIFGNVNLVMPFVTLENIMITGNLQMGQESTNSKLDLKLNLSPEQSFSSNIEWNLHILTNAHFAVKSESTVEKVPFKFAVGTTLLIIPTTFEFLFNTDLNDDKTLLHIKFIRSVITTVMFGNSEKIGGHLYIKTPFAELLDLNAKVDIAKSEDTLDIQIEASLNNRVASLTSNFNLLNETILLVINLPFESLKTITYKSKSTPHGLSRMVEEGELSWTPGPVYTVIFDYSTSLLNPTQRYSMRLLHTPAGYAKSSQIALLETQLDYIRETQNEVNLLIRYKEKDVFQASAYFGPLPLQNKGTGQFSVDVKSIASMMVNVDYDLRNPTKSASVKVSWNDNQSITLRASGQINAETVNANVDILTPFENYKTNNVNLHFDVNKMVGQLEISVMKTSVIVSLEGQKDVNQGGYILRLKSSLVGYKSMSLATNYDTTSSRQRRFILSGSIEKQQFELEIFRKVIDSGITNAGATFTSSIPNFEHVTMDYLGGGKSHALRFERGYDLQLNATIMFNINRENSFIKSEIYSPWLITSLESTLKNTNDEYSSNVTFIINKKVTAFISRLQKFATGHQLHVSLKTPIQSMATTQLDGQYQITKRRGRQIYMNFNIDFAVNDFKVGLDSQNQLLEDAKILLTLTSSLPNYEMMTFAGKWINRLNNKQFDASVSINNQATSMTVTLSSEAAQTVKLQLETPFDGYKRIELTGTYQRNGTKFIDIDATLIKELTKLSIDGRYQMKTEDRAELTLNMETPFEDYKTIGAALSVDTKPNKKQVLFFTLAFSNGEQYRKYQMTSELDVTRPGYLEYNLKLNSPEEESRFYANYNAQGVHNFTFDIKMIKGKTMMESRGRFFASNMRNGQGSLAFNSNYNTLISANFNGMYDFQLYKQEVALQSNINGANNELMATLTTSDRSLDVDIHGECSCLQWRKFSLRGWIKKDDINRDVQLTLSRNEEVFSIRGKLQQEHSNIFGKLTLTTPYLEHQSLEISFANQRNIFAINITNNGEQLINAKLHVTNHDSKTSFKLDVKSTVSFIESTNSEVTYQLSYHMADIKYSFKSNSYNLDSDICASWNKEIGNAKVDINGNVKLPFINDDNFNSQLSYNKTNVDFKFNAMVSSKPLFEFSIKRQNEKDGHFIFNTYIQSFGNIVLDTNYKPLTALNINLKRDNTELFVIHVISNKIDININLLKEPFGLAAYYEDNAINIRIFESHKTIEMQGTVDVSKRVAKATFNSPFEGYKQLAFFASLGIAKQQGHMFNVSIQSSNKPLIALNFFMNLKHPYLEAVFISSFEGYEELRLVIPNLRYENGQIATEIRYTKGAKAFSLTFQFSDRVTIDYKNTFVSAWRHVSLTAMATLSSARVQFSVDDNQNLEVAVKATAAAPLQSSWQFDYRNDFAKQNSLLSSLLVKGHYDLTQTNKYTFSLVAQSENVNQFDARLEYTTGKLELSIRSAIPNLQQFIIQANLKNTQLENAVKISVNLNNRMWTTTGRLEKTNDGFTITVNNNFQFSGVRELKLRTKRDTATSKKTIGGELHVNGRSVGRIEGAIRINLPVTIDAALTVDTPWFKSENLNLYTNFDSSNGKFNGLLQWSPTKKIVIGGHARLYDVQLTVNTPFNIDKISISGLLYKNTPNEINLKSSVTYGDTTVAGIELNFSYNPQQSLDFNLKLITLIKDYETMSLLLLFSQNARNTIQVAIEFTGQLQISKMSYSLEGRHSLDGKIAKSQLTYKTNTMTIELTTDAYITDMSERGLTASLKTPWGTHTFSGKGRIDQHNVGFEIKLDSLALPTNPIGIKASFLENIAFAELATGITKRYVKLTKNIAKAYQGDLVIATSTSSGEIGWQLDFELSKAFSNLRIDLRSLNMIKDESIVSLSYDINRNGQSLDSSLSWKSNKVLSISYTINGVDTEFQIQTNQPLTTKPNELSLTTSKTGGVMKLTLDNSVNYINVNIRRDASERQSNVQLTTALPMLNIPNIKIDGTITHRDIDIIADANISAFNREYKFTGKISRNQMERSGEVTLATPTNKYQIEAAGFYREITNFKGRVSVALDYNTYTTSIEVNSDNGHYTGDFVLEAPLLDKITINANYRKSQNTEGAIVLQVGKITHKVDFKFQRNVHETSIDIQMETPAIDIKTASIKTIDSGNGYTGGATVTSSSASHSMSLSKNHDETSKRMQLIVDTPYLKGSHYSIIGYETHSENSQEMSFNVNTPTHRHAIQINLFKEPNGGDSLRVTINTPLIGHSPIQVTVTIVKLERSSLIGSLEVLQGKSKHQLSADIRISYKTIDFDFSMQTPLFNINGFQTRGEVSITNDGQYVIDLTTKRAERISSIKGFLKPTPNGLDGHLKVDTAMFPPVDVDVKLSCEKSKGFEATVDIKTPTMAHNVQANLFKTDGTFNGILRIVSPLLPGRTLTANANVVLHPTTMQSRFTLENAGNNFRISTEYKSEPEFNRRQGYLIIVTPFEIAPYIKLSSRWSTENNSHEGKFEIYTSEETQPYVGIYTLQSYEENRLSSGYIDVQSTMEKLYNIQLKYDSSISETAQKLSLVLSYNRIAYGYEYEDIRASGSRKINTVLYWSSHKSTFSTEIFISQQRYMFKVMLDAQIQYLPVIMLKYDAATKTNDKKEIVATLITDRVNRFVFTAEYERRNDFIDASFTINSPVNGYEVIEVDVFRSFTPSGQEINFKWTTNNVAMWALQLKNTFNKTQGKSSIQIQTPMESLSLYDIDYVWNKTNQEIVAKGKNKTITMKFNDKSAVVELTGSITFKYTYIYENDFRMELVVPHPTYPLNLLFQKQSNSPLSSMYTGIIMWDNDENSRLILTTFVDRVAPNYEINVGVVHPIRSLNLALRCSTFPDKTIANVEFKYDVNRNTTKIIGFDFNRNVIGNELQNEINFKYPGVEMLAIRSRLNINSQFNHQLEIQYGLDSNQKLTFEISRDDKTTEVRVANKETNYDLQLTSNCRCNSEQYGGQIIVKYIDRQNKQQKVDVEFAILKRKPQVTFQISTMTSMIMLVAQINPTVDGYKLSLEGRFDDAKPNVVELQFKSLSAIKGIEILIFNDNSDGKSAFTLNAGMPNEKTIRVTTNRIINDEEKKDFEFQTNLHQAKELQTRFNWRPHSIQEITNQISQLMHKTCSNAEILANLFKEAYLEISIETCEMIQAISKNVNPNIQPEIDALITDLKPLFAVFNDMYASNDYYVRTFYDNFSQITFHKRLMKYMAVQFDQLTQSVDLKSLVTTAMNHVQQICQYMCKEWIQGIGNQIKKLPTALLNSLQELNYWRIKFINKIVAESITFAKTLIRNWIPPISQWKESAPQWTRHMTARIAEQFKNYTDGFKQSKYYHLLQQSIQQLQHTLNDAYSSKYWTKVAANYDYVTKYLQSKTQALRSCSWFQSIEVIYAKTYYFCEWAYNYLHVEEMAKQFLDSMLERAADIIIFMVEDTLLPEYKLPEMANYFIYDALNGILEFNQSLPVAWNSFTQLPNILGSPEYQQFGQFQKNLLHFPKKTALKLYNAVKSEFNIKATSQAFKATAVLAGNQHYVTFDGKAYEFAGACTYLLARDFINSNFMLTVNYELEGDKVDGNRAIKKSFHLTMGNNTFEIRPDLTIISNNNRVETPSAITTTKFTRTSEVLYIVDDNKQVSFTYDNKFDVLVFEIGGFYHGKTAGLFGIYDHEPGNDLTDPAQRKVQDLEKFTASWEIGADECKSHKNYAYHSNINSHTIQKICRQVFDDPVLIPCLRQSKESYVNMCVNDVSLGLSPCTAVAVYTSVCKAQGNDVTLPESCLDCEVGGSTLHQGEQVSINGSSVPKSADVVFVLDNTWQCSTTFPNLRSTVKTVAKYIEQSLTKNSVPITDNRYALIGLGGPGTSNAPQVITVNNQIFGSVHSLQQAVNSTKQSAGHHHHISEMIQYAYDLPYRSGVSKIIVVVPCSENVDNENEYDDLIEKFKAVNFIVHLVSLHDATFDEANKVKANEILGFDADYSYTLESEKRGSLIGDKKIRQEMKIPDGPLTDLAMDTKGSVFFASKLTNPQPATASLSSEIFARRVALNALPANCQNCKCTVGATGGPQVICSKCN